jgi:hypothetical protein
MQTTIVEKAHPFELAGMGTGPFRFVGMASIPSASLAEQNPSGYSSALAMLPRNLIGGCGTCYNCGKGITHVCIIENAQGQRYGVGTDCVEKTGDKYLGDKAKVAIARIQREQRRERDARLRAEQHKKWLATVCNEVGETNAQRVEREHAEHDAAEKARQAARLAEAEKFFFLLPHLSGPEGGFCASIANQIRRGYVPSGRALDICGDIYAKAHGRRGSKGYDAALDEFYNKIK